MPRFSFASLIVVVLCLGATSAEARCFKCRQDTGATTMSCYMAEGTKSWCEPVGTSGCISGGTCSGTCVKGPNGECLPVLEEASVRPSNCPDTTRELTSEYVLAEVLVYHVRPRTLVASGIR